MLLVHKHSIVSGIAHVLGKQFPIPADVVVLLLVVLHWIQDLSQIVKLLLKDVEVGGLNCVVITVIFCGDANDKPAESGFNVLSKVEDMSTKNDGYILDTNSKNILKQ